jgi:hypothetical protein
VVFNSKSTIESHAVLGHVSVVQLTCIATGWGFAHHSRRNSGGCRGGRCCGGRFVCTIRSDIHYAEVVVLLILPDVTLFGSEDFVAKDVEIEVLG